MKTILCYGDSLTWGYDPVGPARHAYEDRWPSVLQDALGSGVRVIAEGLNGRTTAYDDHLSGADRNGARLLPTLLTSHAPLDLVILLLGSNDMKSYICGSAFGAWQGMRRLVDIVRRHDYPMGQPAPAVLVVAPPARGPSEDPQADAVFADALHETTKLAGLYRQLCEEVSCGFFDAATVARPSPIDGLHLDADNTRAIGAGLAPIVRDILEL
ncbi:SGNH/GDSL hydrolase family protein [Nitratireductor pacificus]|uniref:Lipolytic protein G-D-S-L n=1 Tax=Nitratireductor pacificus pht-3B TaxID=391937 RepID=K2MC02_9HYPH|nr:SGNH/GDSL hydrolase family protein [Nitratireductor pacificus]EKF18380.1 lipolytic protein G-D-S-L [Nitratireductor pacificus pht-3B]